MKSINQSINLYFRRGR